MAELNTISQSDFVKLAKVLFIKGAMSVNNAMLNSGLVKRENISENTGNTREYSSIDTNEYLTYKGEGDQAARGQVQQGYSKTMTKYRVAENIAITYEMIHENKYPEVVSRLTNGGAKGYNSIDLDLSLRISFGASTSYTASDGRTITTTTGDGYQLFYSAHTLNGSSTTYRNILANNPKISKGALEAMERSVVEDTYNQLGESLSIPFDILFTTSDPNSVNTAREYLQSSADVESANSGVANLYKGKYRHVILPRIDMAAAGTHTSTKRYYWGLASSQLSSFYFGMWEEPHMIAPQASANSEDVMTDDQEFRVRAGYGMVVVDGNFIRASKGDGSA